MRNSSGADLKEATGDQYFGNYFKVLPIEKQAKEAVPDLSYGGSCSLEFLGFVHSIPCPGHPLDYVVVGDNPETALSEPHG